MEPMLAEKAEGPFDSPAYIYEVKWDGVRALMHLEEGRVRLWGRNGTDYTDTFPELQQVRVNAQEAWLDGEVVVLDTQGNSDFRATQSRVHRSRSLAVKVAAELHPATFQVFDVLQVNGTDLTALGRSIPQEARKTLLPQLVVASPRCQVAAFSDGEGVRLFEDCMRQGLEGVMAKEKRGLYYPGKRHATWLKVKGVQEDSFLVCGYTAGEGWREGLFGALLLGKPDGRGGLRYCGSVGTGFTVASLGQVQELVKHLHTQKCPFPEAPYEPKLVSYLEPRIVVDVKFHERTPDGKLRFPVFIRVRQDLTRKKEVRHE